MPRPFDVAGLYTSINKARPEYVANTTFVSTDDSAANETAESITNSARSADRLDALRTVLVVIMLLHSRKSVTPGELTGRRGTVLGSRTTFAMRFAECDARP